ncbi:hypothetical protein CARUB_v10016148mg [Capsella rubella]|uniref:VQ domain-containing protein n=1 Tax=Capsella rubella TaxID=81985 RepID=R0I4B6_9BRAS|nr:VQ motif-containing protein 20 [Capsella rubella]EOA32835.1 hypothetical protein CARUB_v10016148mg [Capsella rubella]
MSSTFNGQAHHPKREPNENGILYPPSPSTLKVNKDSHVIKKPPAPSPSSSSSAAAAKPRHPVIIYTHTPKIIHTNPKDFMALVQKLTGMSRSDEDPGGKAKTDRGGKSINQSVSDHAVERKNNRNRGGGGHNSYHRNYSGTGDGKGMFFNNAMISEDSESSSVITTDENVGGEHGQVNSSLPYSAVAIPPPPHPPPPPPSIYDATGINYGAYLPTFPIFPPAADNFLCGTNQPFASIDEQLYFASNMRSSFSSSSSSGFDGLTEFRDF